MSRLAEHISSKNHQSPQQVGNVQLFVMPYIKLNITNKYILNTQPKTKDKKNKKIIFLRTPKKVKKKID